jgi:hypothetical protein
MNQDNVSREDWNKQVEKRKEEKSLLNYFEVLNFSDLINEAHNILDKLKKYPLDHQVANESKALIREISNRINANDQQKFSLNSLEDSLNKKFHEIFN